MPNIIGDVQTGCPVCGEAIIRTCKCFRADSVCKNGHEWHTCVVHKVYVEGHSDHSEMGNTCTCGQDPIDYFEKARKMIFAEFNGTGFTADAVQRLADILEKADKYRPPPTAS